MGFLDRTSQPSPSQWLGAQPGFINPASKGVVRKEAVASGLGSLARTLRGEEQARQANVLAERRLAIAEEGAGRQRKTAGEIDLRRKDEKSARKELDELMSMYQTMDVDAVPEENMMGVAQDVQNSILDLSSRLSQKDYNAIPARMKALPMMQRYKRMQGEAEATRKAGLKVKAETTERTRVKGVAFGKELNKDYFALTEAAPQVAMMKRRMDAMPDDVIC